MREQAAEPLVVRRKPASNGVDVRGQRVQRGVPHGLVEHYGFIDIYDIVGGGAAVAHHVARDLAGTQWIDLERPRIGASDTTLWRGVRTPKTETEKERSLN